jgi:hypothetical protein
MTNKKQQLNEDHWEDERGQRALDYVIGNWSGPMDPPCMGDCEGDYNGDGVVDVNDLLWVLDNWTGDGPGPEPLDVNNPNLGVDNAHPKNKRDKPSMTPYGESWLPNTNKRILKDTWKENLEKSVNEHDGRNRWDPEHPPNWGQHSHEDDAPKPLGLPKPREKYEPEDIGDYLRWLWNQPNLPDNFRWPGGGMVPVKAESTQRPTDTQLTEALMVLSEDKKRAVNPFPESWLHWEWLRKLTGQSEETPPPTLGSPVTPLHKYKV